MSLKYEPASVPQTQTCVEEVVGVGVVGALERPRVLVQEEQRALRKFSG